MAGKNKVKSKVSKTSKLKLANKKQYKCGKQGKIKKQNLKQKRKVAKRLRDSLAGDHSIRKDQPENDEEQELPLEEQDLQFYSTSDHNTSFVHSLHDTSLTLHDSSSQNESKVKKKKRKQETIEDEASYEKIPRRLPADKKMKMLLPTKERSRIIPQMIEQEAASDEEEEEAENEHGDEVTEDQKVPEPVEQSLPALSNVELFALREKKLAEMKEKIALCAYAVMENPQQNMKKLRELYLMLVESDAGVSLTVQSWVMVSLVDVFKDIIPTYKIRLPTENEKHQKMAMDTKTLQDYESALLLNYRKYLEYLELTSRGKVTEFVSKKSKKTGRVHRDFIPKQLSVLAVKCLCQMLIHHSHFNYINNIITVLVPFMNRAPEMSDRVCADVMCVFQQDKTGEVTLEIVRSIGRMIKAKNFSVKPKVLDTFLSLRIKHVDLSSAEGKKDAAKRKEQLLKMSRKQKKHQKQMEKLESELMEVRATEDKKKKLKLHTDVMHAVFVTYFRILKQGRKSGLLPSVFEGLARFAHLINIDFFDDLFAVFKDILESGELAYRQSLQCIQTAFTILSGQGAALNIDPMNFYRHLYQKLFKLHAGSNSKDVLIILDCLDVMICRRKRQVSQQRILAFLKRLCTVSLQHQPQAVLGILSAVRSLIHSHKYTDIVFDNESQGSGVYLPELDDPEHCHAHNSTLWEITTLRNHFHPVVRKYASHVSRLCPSTGEGQLSPDLSRMTPTQLFEKYDVGNEVFDSRIPEKSQKSHRKRQRLDTLSDEMEKYMKQVLERVPDSLSEFSPGISLFDKG